MRKVERMLVGLVALVVALSAGTGHAKEDPANDCLIGVRDAGEQVIADSTVACTDGDTCDADGATDGACKFEIQGCLDLPDIDSCALRPLKSFKFKVKGEKNLIQVSPADPAQATSVCGAFVDLTVELKKKGTKPGKRKLIATATADVKPAKKNKDTDKITFQCNPCASASCVPATTTTTTPTASSTTTTASTTTTTESSTSTTTASSTTTTEGSTSTTESTTTTMEGSTSTTESTTTTTEGSTSTTESTTTTTTVPGSPSQAFVDA